MMANNYAGNKGFGLNDTSEEKKIIIGRSQMKKARVETHLGDNFLSVSIFIQTSGMLQP